jgi:phage baseplate assembly protein W
MDSTATEDSANLAAASDDDTEDTEDTVDEVEDDTEDDEEDSEGLESMDLGFDPESLEENPITRTYGMDMVHHRIKGYVDGKEAVMQAIWKILSTVRYANYIYSDNYGCDIMNRIYNSSLSESYLNTDVPAMIEEALLQDDRIESVSDFSWEKTEKDGVHVTFTAHTIYGDLPVESEVQ